jgi:hypothetical protein
MRGHFARVLLAGLLAMSLHAGAARAATEAPKPPSQPMLSAHPLDVARQVRQLLPATLALMQAMEQAADARGRVLTPGETRIARRLGVMQPGRVRVLVTPILPSWIAPDPMPHGMLRQDAISLASAANAADPGIAGNIDIDRDKTVPERRYGVAGITAGHGILLGIRNAGNPRVLAHELAHVAQYERLGLHAFALRYLTELLSVGYAHAPLELEADAAMRHVLESLQYQTSTGLRPCRSQACTK